MLSESRTATIIIPPPPSRAPPRPPLYIERDRRQNLHELNLRMICDRKSLSNFSLPPVNLLSEHDSEVGYLSLHRVRTRGDHTRIHQFAEETASDENSFEGCISGPSRAWTAFAWNERLRKPEMFRRRLSFASEASSEGNSISPLTSKSSSILPVICEDNSSLTSFSEDDTDDRKMRRRPSRRWNLLQSGSLLVPALTDDGSSSSDFAFDDEDKWESVAPAIHEIALSLVLNGIARRKRLYNQATVSFSAYKVSVSSGLL
jgi:hypothetical protein